jgi:hypothetical protein
MAPQIPVRADFGWPDLVVAVFLPTSMLPLPTTVILFRKVHHNAQLPGKVACHLIE